MVEELDRVFDGDDVDRPRLIHVADHGGKRGGLAVARRADDEDQSPLLFGEHLDGGGRAELIEGGDLQRDRPHHDGERAALAIDIHAEAPETGHGVRAVKLGQVSHTIGSTGALEHNRCGREGVFGRDLVDAEVHHPAAHARTGGLSDLEVDVARIGSHGLGEQLMQEGLGRVGALGHSGGTYNFRAPGRPLSSGRTLTSRVRNTGQGWLRGLRGGALREFLAQTRGSA